MSFSKTNQHTLRKAHPKPKVADLFQCTNVIQVAVCVYVMQCYVMSVFVLLMTYIFTDNTQICIISLSIWNGRTELQHSTVMHVGLSGIPTVSEHVCQFLECIMI